MKPLVTGGAGYIGSVVTALLLAEGHEVVVLLHQPAPLATLKLLPGAAFVCGTTPGGRGRAAGQRDRRGAGFPNRPNRWSASPWPSPDHRGHNLGGSLALLEGDAGGRDRPHRVLTAAGSTGSPSRPPIPETAPTRPTSPYGGSKVAVDTALHRARGGGRRHRRGQPPLNDFQRGGRARLAGRPLAGRAAPAGDPPDPQHPSLAVAAGRGAGKLQLFGDDYPTPDGPASGRRHRRGRPGR